MKVLYLECAMGASGDMLMSALLELVDDPEGFIGELNNLGLKDVYVSKTVSIKNGISGTHVDVSYKGEQEHSHGHEHSHEHGDGHKHEHSHEHGGGHEQDNSSLAEILALIGGLALPETVSAQAKAVYKSLAEAESKAHGIEVSKVHFHELGMMDAICDIVGVCLLMHRLSPDRILASPINVGSGAVKTSHGILPVPAPATAFLLKGVPTYAGGIKAELCTPTGAALLKFFASGFEPMPRMAWDKVGYGMGTKTFVQLNCLRAFWGSSEASAGGPNGLVTELVCNLDDMTGEAIGFACEELFAAGALDVFTVPIQMKKSRPGVMLVCLCPVDKADYFAALMLKHTSTFGVRRRDCSRYELEREITVGSAEEGSVRLKTGSGYGVTKSKTEYEDMARIAHKRGETFYSK